jgi:Xaa-Pro aminopeptidase
VGGASEVAIGDHTWARFVLALQARLGGACFRPASQVTAPLRIVKDAAEVDALAAAATAVDSIATEMRTRRFAGRSEHDVHRELVELMLDAGHERANFAIVAAGPDAASPHHDPGDRTIGDGDVVLCDFGGTMGGYCSDITRMFVVGEPPDAVADAYEVLLAAQEAGVQAARPGVACADIDAAARRVITDAGFGDFFVHRTGHGIGMEAHEEPYIVAGNLTPAVEGHAFSVEPGIYLPGRFGLRLEDIVVVTAGGPRRLNEAPRDLAIVG